VQCGLPPQRSGPQAHGPLYRLMPCIPGAGMACLLITQERWPIFWESIMSRRLGSALALSFLALTVMSYAHAKRGEVKDSHDRFVNTGKKKVDAPNAPVTPQDNPEKKKKTPGKIRIPVEPPVAP